MMEEENKKLKSELSETSKKDEDKVKAENEESEVFDFDWIFDKGWLRTKK